MRYFMTALGAPGFGELLLILLIILLLFGASRIPGIAKSLGKAAKEFKKASGDDSKDTKEH